MSELELLFLVLTLIYLWECLFWLRRGHVAFLAFSTSNWRLTHPATLFGNQTGGLLLANPLPPLGTFLTTAQPALSISPNGVFAYVAHSINPGWRPPQTAKFVTFDAMRKIEATGKKVKVNGELLLRAGSSFLARHIAAQLRRLQELSPAKRPAAIAEMARDSFNIKSIENRLGEFHALAQPVRFFANVLFFYLFLFLPVWISYFGFRRDWMFLLAALLFLTANTAYYFNRACKILYPDAHEERFTHWFTILLSPATAVRAQDALSRPLLESFHPIAVARVLLTRERFLTFSRKVLLDLRHPCLPVCPTNEPAPCAVEQQARQMSLDALKQFLRDQGVNPATLASPPKPADESCRSFCPRCLAQFTTLEGVCTDCGGLPLEPLAAPLEH